MTGADSVTITVLSHMGTVRSENEDAVAVGHCTFTGVTMAEPQVCTVPLSMPVVVAVADGLGGHAAGEVAAAHAVSRLAGSGTDLISRESIGALLTTISEEIASLGATDPAKRGLGTTVVGLLLLAEEAFCFNVGDSRGFVHTGGYLGQLSTDDTPAAGCAEPGAIPEAATIVTQTLGSTSSIPVQPHVRVDPLSPDRAYLLCSDGLTDVVPLEEMERLLEAATDDALAVKKLWAAAMNGGGHDNITVVLVRPGTSEGRPSP